MTISQLLIHMYLSARVGALLSLLNCSVTYRFKKILYHNVIKFCRYFKDASWLLQFLLITVVTFTTHYHVATTYSTPLHKMFRACLSARTAVYCGIVLVYRCSPISVFLQQIETFWQLKCMKYKWLVPFHYKYCTLHLFKNVRKISNK